MRKLFIIFGILLISATAISGQRFLKNRFNAGELTPKLYTAYDLGKYEAGAKTMTNMVPTAHGSAIRRPGFEFIAEVNSDDTGSLDLDGDGDYVSVADHADWYMGTGTFTVDLWMRANAVDDPGSLWGQYTDANNYVACYIASNTLYFTIYDGGSQTTLSGSFPGNGLTADTWYHVAVVRGWSGNANEWALCIDGVEVDSTTVTRTWNDMSGDFLIGYAGIVATYFNGYIDEVRVSKGTARWTDDFTVSTSNYSSDANTQLLLHFDDGENETTLTDSGNTNHSANTTAAGDAKVHHYIRALRGASEYTRLLPFKFSEEDAYVLEFGVDYFRFYKDGAQLGAADANTDLLLHFDGAHNATTTTDDGDTGHTVTVSGYSKLKTDGTPLPKFGSAHSIFLGNVDDYWSIDDHADWYFGSGNFTIDAWVSWDDNTATKGIFSQWASTGEQYTLWYDGANNRLRFKASTGGSVIITVEGASSSFTPTAQTYYHIAVIRGWGGSANDYAITVDGVAVATATDTDDMPDIAGAFRVGNSPYLSVNSHDGFIDEFRVSKGVARWTSTFVPPTQPYPAGDDSYGSGAYEVAHTYTETERDDVHYEQSADVMYLVHENHAQATLTRTSDVSWALADISFTTPPGEWSAADYPRTVAFHEDRLCFGGSPDQPDQIWCSDSSDYYVFTSGAEDANMIDIILAAREVNDIMWIASARRLLIGTNGSEWWLSAASDTEPLTPSSQIAKKDSAYGSNKVMPITIGNNVFYVSNNGRVLREIQYEFQQDRYISKDLTILGEHLTKDYTITDMAYQESPYQILWCVRSDGTLLALTYMKDQDVVAWSKHTSGSAEFESVATIPGDTGEDELWVVVKRTVGGAINRYIERMKPFEYGSIDDAFFVDSGLSYSGTAVTNLSGMDHLEGESVDVLADGVVITGHTISDGAITLSSSASDVHIGLEYSSVLESLDIVTQDQQGALKRITNINVYLNDSLNGQFGPDSSTIESIPYLDSTSLFTGWTEDLSFNEGSARDSTVYLKQADPLPFEVGGIVVEIE